MAMYSITYDLIKDKDYDKIIDAIKAISGTWAKVTLSQWLVNTTMTTTQIRDNLRKHVDKDDIIFVAKIDMPNWSTSNVDKEITEWLHDQVG